MAGSSQKVPPVELQSQLSAAEQLWRTGHNAEAERFCAAVLSARRTAPALCLMGLLLAERGALAEAQSFLREAVALQPGAAALHHHLGNVLQQQGDLEGAEAAYRKAAALKPDYWEAFYNLGVVRAGLGREAEALAAHRRALAINPRAVAAQVQIGRLLHKAGDDDAALAMLDAAAAAAPERFDAHYYRGVALAARARFAEAAAAQAQATRLAPARFEGHMALGNALVRLGRETEALAAYRRAIEADPAQLSAHREFNDLAWTLGHDVRALGSHAYARSRLGDTPDLLLAEAELRMRFFEGAPAEALLARAPAADQGRADIADARGRALALQKRYGEAAAQFARAIEAEPDAPGHRRELAIALLKDGRGDAARKALDEVLARAPLDQQALGLRTLAARLTGEGDYLARFENLDWVRVIDLPLPPGFADAASFNAALAEELTQFHTRKAPPLDQTLHAGTQTPGALFGRPSRLVALLEDSLRRAIAGYIRGLPDDPGHPFLSRKSEAFGFSGSWSCRLFSSGFHTNHVHHQGWISSAYYVDLPPQVAAGEGGQGALKFGESPFGLGERDRPLRAIRPVVGRLVLFPSYFWHGTVPFTSDRARLTVAFDVVPADGRS